MNIPAFGTFIAFEINENELIKEFAALFSENRENFAEHYLKICKILLLSGKNLSDYLHDALIFSEQPLTEKYIEKENPLILKAIEFDVDTIKQICELNAVNIKKYFSDNFGVDMSKFPEYESGRFPYNAEYFINRCRENGSGIFAQYKAFRYADKEIKPIVSADAIKLNDLKRYEAQKKQIVANTEAFLKNKPACSVLLYGDRGTGKSSTVKALLNEYPDLRMIQLDKAQVSDIFEIYEKLRKSTLHFIIFIDDLSFSENDEGFFVLKQALDGSIAAMPNNVLIYATTNRRHIIKETAENRAENYVHKSDAVDDNMSLAERFGLFVTFSSPNKEQLADIAVKIAKDRGLSFDTDKFETELEKFALRRGGRSPRIAKQFTDMLEAGNIKI